MDISKERSLERLKYLEVRLRTEVEKMNENLQVLSVGWNDPGAELIKTEMKRQIMDAGTQQGKEKVGQVERKALTYIHYRM